MNLRGLHKIIYTLAQGVTQGMETAKISIAKSLLGLLADEFIAEHVGLPLEAVKELHEEK